MLAARTQHALHTRSIAHGSHGLSRTFMLPFARLRGTRLAFLGRQLLVLPFMLDVSTSTTDPCLFSTSHASNIRMYIVCSAAVLEERFCLPKAVVATRATAWQNSSSAASSPMGASTRRRGSSARSPVPSGIFFMTIAVGRQRLLSWSFPFSCALPAATSMLACHSTEKSSAP